MSPGEVTEAILRAACGQTPHEWDVAVDPKTGEPIHVRHVGGLTAGLAVRSTRGVVAAGLHKAEAEKALERARETWARLTENT